MRRREEKKKNKPNNKIFAVFRQQTECFRVPSGRRNCLCPQPETELFSEEKWLVSG